MKKLLFTLGVLLIANVSFSQLFNALTKQESQNTQAENGAIIYIGRPFQYVGAGMKVYIEINGQFIGNLPSGNNMKIRVPAGNMDMNLYQGNGSYEKLKEKYGGFNKSVVNININVEDHQEYFFQYSEAAMKFAMLSMEEDSKVITRLKKNASKIPVSEKLYAKENPTTDGTQVEIASASMNIRTKGKTNTTNENTVQNSSAGGRSYSIEELQALGVIGGGNNNQQPAQQVASTQNSQPQQTAPQRTLSDVDKNIPVTDHRAENTFVLIIANEDYQFVDKVDFAKNDGQTFKEYCIKTLGVPEKQVWLYENASYGVIKSGISKMTKAMNLFDNPNAIIYYCGHGIPDEKTGDAYLIPTDGNGKDMATCYSLNLLYKTFAETKAANVTYFMDACFTGASKEGSMLVAARGVLVNLRKKCSEAKRLCSLPQVPTKQQWHTKKNNTVCSLIIC